MSKFEISDNALAITILGAIGSGHRATNTAEREAFRRGIRLSREEIEQAIKALANAALQQLEKSGGEHHGNRSQ